MRANRKLLVAFDLDSTLNPFKAVLDKVVQESTGVDPAD